VLTEQGLEPAVRALATRAPVPVRLDAEGGERLPAAVEIAAYYVVSEALANVAKYAQASAATVAIRRAGGRVTVDVSDDGIGGADTGRGSGLSGLADRLGALDGTLAVESPAGHGTRLHAEIPYPQEAVVGVP
jgi:signal transduction histidine kinase